MLELSLREALNLHHGYIGTEHILLGLIREGEGVAAQVLVRQGARLDVVRAQVIALLGRQDLGLTPSLEEERLSIALSFFSKVDRLQETLDRIERRLDALGAPPDPGAQGSGDADLPDPADPPGPGTEDADPPDPDTRDR